MDDTIFDWKTEDESEWGNGSNESKPPPQHRGRTRLVVLIALLIGAGIYWQIQRQADAATARIEADLRAGVGVLLQASADRDLELFNRMLSGRNMAWADAQQTLIANNGLFDRATFDWRMITDTTTIDQLAMTPDLASAHITLTVQYDLDLLENPVTLQLPLYFRKGVTQWLYTPPPPEFWGEEIIRESIYLISRYPARDAALIEQLIGELDEMIGRTNTVEFGYYPPEQQIQITFSTDPNTLLAPQINLTNNLLTLPAPSLLGTPTDEAGYRALFNYYASAAYTPVFNVAQHNHCCDRPLYFNAFLDWELAQRGLRQWPLTTADREQVLARTGDFSADLGGWNKEDIRTVTDDERRFAYAFVQFVHQLALQPHRAQSTPPIILPSWTAEGNPLSFSNWTTSILDERQLSASSDALDQAFYDYLQQLQSQLPPIDLPEETMVISCNISGDEGMLLTYPAAANLEWQLYDTLSLPSQSIRALPDQSGLWVNANEGQVWLWRNGEETPLPDGLRYFGVHSPDDTTVAAMRVGNNGQSNNSTMSVINLDTCSAENCPVTPRHGQVIWSSDGQHQLIRDFSNLRTTVLDSNGELVKVIGISPQEGMTVWVDEQTVGWLGGPDWYMRSTIGSNEAEMWIGYDNFQSLLPDHAIEKRTLRIHDAGYIDRPNLKIVQLYDDITPRYMLSLDPATNMLRYIPELDDAFFLTASRNGRWLAAAAFDDNNQGSRLTELILYNRETGETSRYPYSSASRLLFPNSTDDWAMIFEQEQIRLIAPEHDYVEYLLPPFEDCNSAAWLNLTDGPIRP